MSVTAFDGVVAAGHVPVFVIPIASLPTGPAGALGAWTAPLTALTGPNTAKIDCHMDAGDATFSRTPTNKTRQRLCQVVAQTIKTGETIEITISAVYDQQEDDTEAINDAYAAMPEQAEVFIAIPYGWDSSAPPTASTKADIFRGKVQLRDKNFPTSIDEDLKFIATISGSAYFEDVSFTA